MKTMLEATLALFTAETGLFSNGCTLFYFALAASRHLRAPLTQHMLLGSTAPELTLCVWPSLAKAAVEVHGRTAFGDM